MKSGCSFLHWLSLSKKRKEKKKRNVDLDRIKNSQEKCECRCMFKTCISKVTGPVEINLIKTDGLFLMKMCVAEGEYLLRNRNDYAKLSCFSFPLNTIL